jgi:hypothetical protein
MGIDMTGAPSVHPVAFPGDPGHEAGTQPMKSLKGGCTVAPVQAMSLQEANTGSAVGNPSDTSGNISGWDNTTLADSGGARGHGDSGLYKSNKGFM